MSTINFNEALQRELSILPTSYSPEVLRFIESLKTNHQSTAPTTMLFVGIGIVEGQGH